MNPELQQFSLDNAPDAAQSMLPPEEIVRLHFSEMQGALIRILNDSAASQTQLSAAQGDLEVYKRAYNDLQFQFKKLEESKAQADMRRNELENHGNRVVALIDGDGAIFDTELIGLGQTGGHSAAEKLLESVKRYLLDQGMHTYHLYVYIFLNQRGLSDTFGRHGLLQAKKNFSDFVIGFNQAKERFLMVDVGNAKEGADSKIKAILESEIRLPQTKRVIFGGCHDNGYVTTLRSHITDGYKEKLILLPGYTEIAAGITEFGLPHISISGLFQPEKFPSAPQYAFGSTVADESYTLVSAHMKPGTPSPQKAKFSLQKKEGGLTSASALPDLEVSRSKARKSSTSYSTMAQAAAYRRPNSPPDLDSGLSSASSEDVDDFPPVPASARRVRQGTRKPDPKLPMSKQDPPPCTMFYLTDNCKFGADCVYGHDYILLAEQYTEIRENAKKTPCTAVNSNTICTWAEKCCFGHKCPQGNKCYFLTIGKCFFKGRDMHKA